MGARPVADAHGKVGAPGEATPRWRGWAAWIAGLVVLHAAFALAGLDSGTNVVLALCNVFALLRGLEIARRWRDGRVLAYAAGYGVLFLLLYGFVCSPLLFATFAFLYAGSVHSGLLLGYVLLLLFSIVFVSPYWVQVFALLAFAYTIVYSLRGRARDAFSLGAFAVGFVLLALVVLPILYLMFQSTPQTLMDTAQQREFQSALINTFWTATVTTLIVLVFGVPLAYAMARMEFKAKGVVDSLIDLPILIPQSVAGIALMVIFGPKTPAGQFLESHFGISVSGSYLGIIACQIFVASPFLIRAAMNAFQQMDAKLENVSRTLGAPAVSTFFRVSIPIAGPSIFTGAILTWARAVSETGSIMVIAYRPLTIGTLTFDTFTQYGLEEARPVAVVLVLVCLWAFIALRWARGYVAGALARQIAAAGTIDGAGAQGLAPGVGG